MQTQLNALSTAQAVGSTLPLTAAQAKRVIGVRAATAYPVRYAGRVVVAVQRKRHPYDTWTNLHLAGEVDTTNSALRYRAVVK